MDEISALHKVSIFVEIAMWLNWAVQVFAKWNSENSQLRNDSTYSKTANFWMSSNCSFTSKISVIVHDILHFARTLENIFVYHHISHVCSVFRPTAWTIYSFSAVCLCSIGRSKQINNGTERTDGASLSPLQVSCAVVQFVRGENAILTPSVCTGQPLHWLSSTFHG